MTDKKGQSRSQANQGQSEEEKTANSMVQKQSVVQDSTPKGSTTLSDQQPSSNKAPHEFFAGNLVTARRLQSSPVAIVISFLILAIVAWSIVTKIDQFTSIGGRIIPQGNIMNIQHLEGGIIENIYVSAGQIVKKDDLLVRVSLSGVNRSLDEIKAELGGLYLRRQRLHAERDDTPLQFDPSLAIDYSEIAAAERQSFNSRRSTLNQEQTQFELQLNQETITAREIENRINSTSRELDALQKNLDVQKGLAEEGLISGLDIFELEARVEAATARRLLARESRSLAMSRQQEIQKRYDSIYKQFRESILKELLAIENKIETVDLAQIRVQERDLRRDIRSPASGTIKEIHQTTPGAVIRPGGNLIDLVPETDQLIVEAYLPPSERGKVSVGQEVLVKVSAYDFLRFGGLEGEVISISADAFIDEQKGSYYKIEIKTAKTWLGETPSSAPLTPGMDVIADIKSAKRRVITYLLYPVLQLSHNAFRE